MGPAFGFLVRRSVMIHRRPDVRVSHFGGDQRQCDLNHIMQRSAGDTLAVKNEAQPRLSGEYKKLKNIVSMRSKLSMSDFAVGMLGSAA